MEFEILLNKLDKALAWIVVQGARVQYWISTKFVNFFVRVLNYVLNSFKLQKFRAYTLQKNAISPHYTIWLKLYYFTFFQFSKHYTITHTQKLIYIFVYSIIDWKIIEYYNDIVSFVWLAVFGLLDLLICHNSSSLCCNEANLVNFDIINLVVDLIYYLYELIWFIIFKLILFIQINLFV